GKNDPFPIQADTLPDTLAGRDVLGRGNTGSGKTLAFSLPLVARLAAKSDRRRGRKPRALVLAPPRELANQIDEVIKPLAAAY
ncbi:DEAD/DEAH box helicase, partial [Acinetobacter baumannii]